MPVLTPQTDGDRRLGFSVSGGGWYDAVTLSVHSSRLGVFSGSSII